VRVFNLGQSELIYKGRPIPPNGGSVDIPDLTFVPDRDRANKHLAFGSLPRGWKPPAPPAAPVVEQKKAAPAPVKAPEPEAVEAVPEPKADESKVEAKESWKRKMK
jgi:hypothetical protein